MAAKETRARATRRVTAGVCRWLFKTGCRGLALEPGLRSHGLITTPWEALRWRADVAGAAYRHGRTSLYVVEVKATNADMRREDYDKGKWMQAMSCCQPWLAISHQMQPPPDLPGHWGVLRIDAKGGYKRLRQPNRPALPLAPGDEIAVWAALAQINTLQRLPSWFTGLTAGQALRQLTHGEFMRPWSLWAQRPIAYDIHEEEGIL